MSAPLFILAGNGPYDNRGCEAIVRGTVAILRRHFEGPRFFVCSQFYSQKHLQRQQQAEKDLDLVHARMDRLPNFPKRRFLIRVLWTLYKMFPSARRNHIYGQMLGKLKDSLAVLSIGGDNYSMDYNSLLNFTDLDDLAESRRARLVIWGASVGPFDKDPALEKRMGDHLQRQPAIFVRESRSMKYLEGIGVRQNVHETVDPAFAMDAQEPPDAAAYPPLEGSIGLNFSPLMANYICGGNRETYRSLCADVTRAILDKFDRPILFVPHVMDDDKDLDDHYFMEGVWEAVDSSRITLLDPCYNAAETKWFISRCHVFAGGRTHSTIAALSSEVPTLSFGYSFKAEGLNHDVYGHQSYCISAAQFSPENIVKTLEKLLNDRERVRDSIQPIVRRMKERAFDSGVELKKICEAAR